MKKTFLTVEIYRASYNCAINYYNKDKRVFCPVNGGSIKEDELLSYSENCSINPLPVRIVKRNLPSGEYIHAEPNKPGMWAFGGSYLGCSDSRIHEINKYPIPLHDRDMNME